MLSCILAAFGPAKQGEPPGLPVETIFRLATAFTHPRRIELFRLVQKGTHTVDELRAETQISRSALLRHLHKKARGFIRNQGGIYGLVNRQSGLGGELARMAAM